MKKQVQLSKLQALIAEEKVLKARIFGFEGMIIHLKPSSYVDQDTEGRIQMRIRRDQLKLAQVQANLKSLIGKLLTH